ncbi:MAG: DUF1015 domain-containing protein [Candidatus Omnitrophota bacterium]
MAEIKPFKGILYNEKKVDIAKVVTPPYDIISQSMQNRFYHADPHNIIRLILGKEEKSDTSRNNRYTRSALFLERWLRGRIFVKDTKPSIYIYTQEYLYRRRKRTRIGFIALMKIEDPKESGILPHEYTLDKPKADRFNLIVKTKANLSPIFCLFQDRENRISGILKRFVKSRDALFAVDAEGVTHKLWRVQGKSMVEEIKKCMRSKKIFIADGHHRYEVALTYRNRMKRSKNYKKNVDYIMMYFSNLSERGNLTILSTHRVVRNIPGFGRKKIIPALKRYFRVKSIKRIGDLLKYLDKTPKGKHSFGVHVRGKFYLLALKEKYSADNVESKKTDALKRLNVTILHDLIIDKILGVKNSESSIKYIRNEKDALALIDRGDYEMAFFLRPTQVSEMTAVAKKGELMPQKSTYFYPKLLTGLVINKF